MSAANDCNSPYRYASQLELVILEESVRQSSGAITVAARLSQY